jgi:hypothetical protein
VLTVRVLVVVNDDDVSVNVAVLPVVEAVVRDVVATVVSVEVALVPVYVIEMVVAVSVGHPLPSFWQHHSSFQPDHAVARLSNSTAQSNPPNGVVEVVVVRVVDVVVPVVVFVVVVWDVVVVLEVVVLLTVSVEEVLVDVDVVRVDVVAVVLVVDWQHCASSTGAQA